MCIITNTFFVAFYYPGSLDLLLVIGIRIRGSYHLSTLAYYTIHDFQDHSCTFLANVTKNWTFGAPKKRHRFI